MAQEILKAAKTTCRPTLPMEPARKFYPKFYTEFVVKTLRWA